MSEIDTVQDLALHLVGTPYLWGGDDPMSGFDCSGLCIELLKSVGSLPRAGDWTADGLMTQFGWPEVPWGSLRQPGQLVFWGGGGKASHVEMVYKVYGVVDPLIITVGASGGGSATNSQQVAVRQNAYIKLRPVTQLRGGKPYIKTLEPFEAAR